MQCFLLFPPNVLPLKKMRNRCGEHRGGRLGEISKSKLSILRLFNNDALGGGRDVELPRKDTALDLLD